MIKYTIVCVGNLKDKEYIGLQEEFQKRCSRFVNLEIIELKEYTSESSTKKMLEKEGKEILNRINGYVILLDVEGKQLSSPHFATYLKTLELEHSNLTFVIGGSYGVSDAVKERANLKLSFSKMTFPHRLARIMLLEQIYRTATISNNITYHK